MRGIDGHTEFHVESIYLLARFYLKAWSFVVRNMLLDDCGLKIAIMAVEVLRQLLHPEEYLAKKSEAKAVGADYHPIPMMIHGAISS